MKDILRSDYAIHVRDSIHYKGIEGYRDDQYLYFIIPATNKETLYMEQAALTYYLVENGYNHVALPVPTINGEWFRPIDNTNYMVLRIQQLQGQISTSYGKKLAEFHQLSSNYQYEPQEISSYGQWKDLWINKLMAFENKVNEESKSYSSSYYRLVMDILPYIIGISENAIQYMQETESETRYHLHDQGTFSFQRYRNNLHDPIIWMYDLVYDHPARDISEFIRNQLLWNEEDDHKEIANFVHDYQSVRPVSIFSWRLVYARLLFPVHLFDCLEKGFSSRDFAQQEEELKEMIHRQEKYEQKLASIFEMLQVDYQSLEIPVLHWLK
ncbi:spore coat protein YutH [Oceanobacillus limi]|uniref:Spore coat protein YutH n=1 Tax=Oceanobacillus limi TaxID=930131 RepID=A0A1I0DNS6_9BACI|nr:hypothetical protein [Oceanobacillus limi]SET34189.1 spore coat protein YutH [Oceanobacillus limi]